LARAVELFRTEPRARTFFVALTQSALGTGAAYVALLLVAYERFESAWAISLVLMADLVPAMMLGPIFGAAADRWSRKSCLILSDVTRAVAFLGIALVDSFPATVALAVLAGAGTGLFTPAALASIPGLVRPTRLAAATSVYGVIADVGFTAGPAIAAAVLLVAGPEWILTANAATFLASAALLGGLAFGSASIGEPDRAPRASLLREAREGLAALSRMMGIRVVLVASAAGLFFAGLFNVAELLFATGELGSGESGFSVLAMAYGLGFVGGSLAGSRGGEAAELKKWFLTGLALMGAGFLTSGLAPDYWVALMTFALAGVGNGMLLVYERLIIQTTVPDSLMARVFGAKDALTAWAFAVAFVSAGAVIAAIDTRPLLLVAGTGSLLAWILSRLALRKAWTARTGAEPAGSSSVAGVTLARDRGALGNGAARQHRAHLGGRGQDGLSLHDDLGDGGNDSGIELRPGVGG
jgi:MFS family permease